VIKSSDTSLLQQFKLLEVYLLDTMQVNENATSLISIIITTWAYIHTWNTNLINIYVHTAKKCLHKLRSGTDGMTLKNWRKISLSFKILQVF
jgi:hypothetical protein